MQAGRQAAEQLRREALNRGACCSCPEIEAIKSSLAELHEKVDRLMSRFGAKEKPQRSRKGPERA